MNSYKCGTSQKKLRTPDSFEAAAPVQLKDRLIDGDHLKIGELVSAIEEMRRTVQLVRSYADA